MSGILLSWYVGAGGAALALVAFLLLRMRVPRPATLVPHVKHVPRKIGSPVDEAYRKGWQDACMALIKTANDDRKARVERSQAKVIDGVLVRSEPEHLLVSLVDVASGAEHLLRSCPK
jgi:hypothetical protein